MWLAVARTYEPRWTNDIHNEWIRGVLRDRPDLTPKQLERTRRLMDQINPDCLVYGYETRIPNVTLPDENDRHVLAAAIESGAGVNVTFNRADFPAAVLRPYGIRAMLPHEFLQALFHQQHVRFLRGLRQHRASLKRPPKSVDEYLESLVSLGLLQLVSLLQTGMGEL